MMYSIKIAPLFFIYNFTTKWALIDKKEYPIRILLFNVHAYMLPRYTLYLIYSLFDCCLSLL